jgi:hypothetical protein
MVGKETLGRYETVPTTGLDNYVTFKYLRNEGLGDCPVYLMEWGAVGFEAFDDREIVGDTALREAQTILLDSGYRKLKDDEEIPMSERPNKAIENLKAWLSV